MVRCHRNLNRKVWSVREGGGPVRHEPGLTLEDCTFVVGEGGRQRALREGRRNVHAYVRGRVVGKGIRPHPLAVRLSYNPFRTGAFVVRSTGREVWSARKVYLTREGHIYAIL